MKIYCWTFAWAILQATFVFSQTAPKYEMRGVWIATVKGLDFPNKRQDGKAQEKDLRNQIRAYKEQGMNAIFFQVRATSDAFYQSSYEPWSEFLTGTQGKSPKPFYDPLAVAIDECHQQGMELHAWINPYRAVLNVEKDILHKSHIAIEKPAWIVVYGKKGFLNPGLPEVREYVTRVIMDIVKNYDIDGVHFDDYFYPYQIQGEVFEDENAFKKYNPNKLKKEDWRRTNIDFLIKMVSDSIRITKPFVKFGISPGGVWRNQRDDPKGSATRAGQPTYDYLFADPLKWLENDWIDYIAPQIYWSVGYELADFEILIDWWKEHTYGKHLYIGHAFYKVTEGEGVDKNWANPSEIPKQIRMTRNTQESQGSIFFRGKYLINNGKGVTDTLKQNLYKYPALPPKMDWKDNTPPNSLEVLNLKKDVFGVVLEWERLPESSLENNYFVIYRVNKNEKVDIENPKNIVSIQKNNRFVDESAIVGENYVYLVTVVDRLHNESKAVGKTVFRYGEDWQDSTGVSEWKSSP